MVVRTGPHSEQCQLLERTVLQELHVQLAAREPGAHPQGRYGTECLEETLAASKDTVGYVHSSAQW